MLMPAELKWCVYFLDFLSLTPNGGTVCNSEKYNPFPVNKDKFMTIQKF